MEASKVLITEGSSRSRTRVLEKSSEDQSSHIQQTKGRVSLNMISKLAVCTVSGILFGFAAEKGQVHVPAVIINQMQFSQFTMLKMFLSAVATSVLVFCTLSMIPYTKRFFTEISSTFSSGFGVHTMTRSVAGGMILGAGMTLCGSCPGMVLVQIGSGTQNAGFTMMGCLAGALLYGMVDSYLPIRSAGCRLNQFVYKWLNIPYQYIAMPFALLLIGVVLTVENFVPWRQDNPGLMSDTATFMFSQKAWNPALAGMLIGLVQIPILFTIGDTIGGSSAYCTLLSKAIGSVGLLSNRLFHYFAKFNKGIENWWQVYYIGGAIVGGYVSATLSGSLGNAVGVSPISAVFGGMCLLFGARLASGCTSGHGVSGMALFSVHSFLATPAMFAGGIGTALLLQQLPL